MFTIELSANGERLYMEPITQEQIIDAAKEAAKRQGTATLSRTDFERLTGISQYHVYKLFPDGGWSAVISLSGLEEHPRHKTAIGDDDLLMEFHRVSTSLGRIPTWTVFAAQASISADVVRRRFGGLQGTLKRYQLWLSERDPTSPLLALLQTHSLREISQVSERVVTATTSGQWTKAGGVEYGAPINFRGLRHAPINEQGVVYLFGMVSYELGFLVEAVHTSYPDCDAKRCIDKRANRWQHVRIEFEYRSRNFKEHGHDPLGCDVIVCWEHDWPDCPLEAISLRHMIDELNG